MKKRFLICLPFAFVVTMVSYATEEDAQKPVILQLQWIPQAQFAGYIMAYEKGFFKQEGIDVLIRFGEPEVKPLGCVTSGDADFCTAWLSQALTLRADGKPLVNICQIFQKSSLMLIAWKKSGIFTPKDMNDKHIGFWPGDFSIQPKAFLRKNGISASLIPQSVTVDAFLAEAIDITSAMFYNEYHKIIQSGVDEDELVTFLYSDYGLNFPEDGIYCSEKTLRSKPNLCRKMRKAIIAGWEYAFSHPDEAIGKILEYCRSYPSTNARTNRAHQRWMLGAIKTSITYGVGADPSDWGILKKDDFLRVAGELKKQGFIEKIPTYEEFYRAF